MVMEGPVFRQLVLQPDGSIDLDAVAWLWPRLRVLARCTPTDKYILVCAIKALRQQGRLQEVIAVTGTEQYQTCSPYAFKIVCFWSMQLCSKVARLLNKTDLACNLAAMSAACLLIRSSHI